MTHVLVIDDNPINLKLVCDLLECAVCGTCFDSCAGDATNAYCFDGAGR